MADFDHVPSLADQIYEASPVWMQQAIFATYGAWWYRRRFSSRFKELVGELVARERFSADELRAYQATRLRELLTKARASAHYRPLVESLDLRNPFEALAQMPMLAKETLRTAGKSLLTREPPRGTMVFRSSGSTGKPVEIFYTPEFHAQELALGEARNLRWAGVSYRDRRVMFAVRKVCRWDQDRPPFWRVSPVENMAYCSIYHLSPEHLDAYVEFLQRYHPAIVMGAPSALAVVARHALEHDKLLPPARAIVNTCEAVFVEDRLLLEKAWQCKVWDRYGAVEGCVFASMCEHGRHHVSSDIGLVEIVDADGKPCAPGVLGEVVATGLTNTLQPLIRYRIGDAARWAVDQTCPCGRHLPVLEAIEGRLEDVCVTADGRQLLRFDSVFKGVPHIHEAQIIQKTVDLFHIRVVPTSGFGPPEVAMLERNMRQHVGTARIDVVEVAEIPRMASGKFRAVLCELTPETKRQLIATR